MMLVHLILENDNPHSVVQSGDECEKYLAELRKVHPDAEWTSEEYVLGRKAGHEEGCCWGFEGVYDLVKKRIIYSIKAWVWASQCNWQKSVNAKWFNHRSDAVIMDRFIPVFQNGNKSSDKWHNEITTFFDEKGTVNQVDEIQVKLILNK